LSGRLPQVASRRDDIVGGVSLSDEVYVRLLALRTSLRQFERWSEQPAQAAGLTPAQHQLLLAIRGHGDARGPTIGDVADQLLLRHHSVVGLIDRADAAGLVRRVRDDQDHRVVRLHLAPAGAKRLEALSALHLEELERLAAKLPAPPPADSAQPRRSDGDLSGSITIARAYEDPGDQSGRRFLVDRLWPRGVSRSDASLTAWMKDAAPSTDLRKWYGHVPDRFDEFARRYRAELRSSPGDEAVEALRGYAHEGDIVLVTATRDVDRSGAIVLRDVLMAAG
jgi:uncharacterized protein YeaO (DUF488 family)/DNA-binding MarR family transcriptional regulator